MSLAVVTTATMIQCPHAIPATLVSSASKVLVDSMPPLVMGDKPTVAGCPFMVGSKPQPCATVLLTKTATKVLAENKAVLLMNPADIAQSADQIPQGPAVWGNIQSKVLAT
ncbi:MAG TPA: hypothetical protein VF547_03225 [Allosphingosinicella sp.]|jgi:hypothetical protein